MNNVLITGATGLVGSRLIPRFSRVLITTRNPGKASDRFGDAIGAAIKWDASQTLDLTSHQPFDAVVNLMGDSIAEGRWTEAKKKRIRDSRVLGTRHLVEAILALKNKPKAFVSASAVGYYGDHGDRVIDESMPPGDGFLAEVCQQWEDESKSLEDHGIRRVILRIGIVMARDGGALPALMPIFKTGLAGRLGNGNQYFPWIHIDDLASLIEWSVKNESASGVLNATAPNPVTNREFTRTLAAKLGRPAFLPVPQFALRIALGEFANSLFVSHRAMPQAALNQGFEFQFNELDNCLANLLSD